MLLPLNLKRMQVQFLSVAALICTMNPLNCTGIWPCKRWGEGVMASQLDLTSLTQLFGAGCGQLQLEVEHWVTSVALLQVVDK